VQFQRIAIVDWSANARPKRGADSIWFGAWSHDDGAAEPVNLPTRHAAVEFLAEYCAGPGRTLVGFDFPMGYPAGLAAALGLPGTPWRATWDHLSTHLHDESNNRNDRWDVAADLNRRLGAQWFWGVPPRRASTWLSSTKSTLTAPPEFRLAEARLRELGKRPFSARHLLGVGSVGSQALTGIPAVDRLRRHPSLAHRARVWPFETGLVPHPAGDIGDAIVLAEVWPSVIDFDHIDHPVKDARQVTALATHLAALDRIGALPVMFAPAAALSHRAAVEGEEGWVLTVE
jgi:precorrin-8X/cobalt-precorrin-8 methylmutase